MEPDKLRVSPDFGEGSSKSRTCELNEVRQGRQLCGSEGDAYFLDLDRCQDRMVTLVLLLLLLD